MAMPISPGGFASRWIAKKLQAGSGIRFNEHMEGDGETVFLHACKLGLEGIVSKRKDSAYRSGRSPDWLKMKTPMHRP
jgi:ATP-dependent DNA ligase